MVKCGEQEFQHGGAEIGGECACGVVGSPPVMFIADICHKQPAVVYFFRSCLLFSTENAKFLANFDQFRLF